MRERIESAQQQTKALKHRIVFAVVAERVTHVCEIAFVPGVAHRFIPLDGCAIVDSQESVVSTYNSLLLC